MKYRFSAFMVVLVVASTVFFLRADAGQSLRESHINKLAADRFLSKKLIEVLKDDVRTLDLNEETLVQFSWEQSKRLTERQAHAWAVQKIKKLRSLGINRLVEWSWSPDSEGPGISISAVVSLKDLLALEKVRKELFPLNQSGISFDPRLIYTPTSQRFHPDFLKWADSAGAHEFLTRPVVLPDTDNVPKRQFGDCTEIVGLIRRAIQIQDRRF